MGVALKKGLASACQDDEASARVVQTRPEFSRTFFPDADTESPLRVFQLSISPHGGHELPMPVVTARSVLMELLNVALVPGVNDLIREE